MEGFIKYDDLKKKEYLHPLLTTLKKWLGSLIKFKMED
jgi:hypothetical protein